MTSSERPKPAEIMRAAAPEVLTGIWAAWAGLDPVVAAALPPAVGALWRAAREADHQALIQGAKVVATAAETLHGDAADVERWVSEDAARTELFRRTVQAAGRSTFEEKVIALGRVLASGLGDDAKVDEALFLATALSELDVPHVQVLQSVERYPSGPDGLARMAYRELTDALPGYELLLPAILQTLTVCGLAEDLRVGNFGGVSAWEITALGRRCLGLLREAGAAPPS